MSARRLLAASSGSHVDANGMITDSWETFIEIVKSGKARQYYELGNYIPLDLGEHGTLNMGIIAFDPAWPRNDLMGYPNIALFSKECLNDTYNQNSFQTTIDGTQYVDTTHIYRDIIHSYLPSWLKREIISVYRPYHMYGASWINMMRSIPSDLYSVWTLDYPSDIGSYGASSDFYTYCIGQLDIDPLNPYIKKKLEPMGLVLSIGQFYPRINFPTTMRRFML